MCGIAGILRLTPAPGGEARTLALRRPLEDVIPEAWLDTLDASIRHRGPDGQGRFRDRSIRPDGSIADIALLHRRLSILDHGGGAQPMVSPRGPRPRETSSRPSELPPALLFHGSPTATPQYAPVDATDLVAVTFNGCIYNHGALRAELTAAGHTFRSDHSDTEVFLHGWRQWGRGLHDDNDGMAIRIGGLFERTEDMFALGLWDRASALLILARDHFGQKPLYVMEHQTPEGLLVAFSSTIPGLVRLQRQHGIAIAADTDGVVRWLRFGADSQLPIAGLREVPPSSALVYAPNSDTIDFYHPPAVAAHMTGVLSDARIMVRRYRPLDTDEVDRLLRASVAARLQADVPLGCFLSGGVDSSLIAQYARELHPGLSTFSVRMPAREFDESSHASAVAQLLGTRHHTLDVDASPAPDLVALIQQLGLPFGDSSLLPTTWLSRAVRRHATVALAGDGGDELFGGYERYRAAAWLRVWPLLALLPADPGPNPRTRRSLVARLADAASNDLYCDLVSIFPTSMLRQLVGAPAAKSAFEIEHTFGRSPRTTDSAIEHDLEHYLPSDLLRKADTASMSVALELREPFLDATLAAAARSATLRSLMPRGRRKGLLRAVARRYLPAPIVDRPKQGFAIPIGQWFRDDFGGLRTLLMDHLNSREPFAPALSVLTPHRTYIDQLIREHLHGQRDHSQRLYTLLVMSVWSKWLQSASQ